jgi:cob(I)alamin adenosyltransferase
MSISTRGGDKGFTSVYTGERVPKDHIICEICGTGDEFVCHLGELKHYIPEFYNVIENIQKEIFKINSFFATIGDKKEIFLISNEEIDEINKILEEYEKQTGELKGFIIPSENILAAKTDICRTICRRYERRMITYSININEVPETILQYVNRLSDVLYVIARLLGRKKEAK